MRARRRTALALLTVIVAGLSLGMVQADPTAGSCESPDAGNTSSAATPIGIPAACTGQVSETTDVDWYSFAVPDGSTVNASLSTAPTSVFKLTLVDPKGTPSTGCSNNICRETSAGGGTWLAAVEYADKATGQYALVIDAQNPLPKTCETDKDAGNDPATAATPPVTPAGGTVCTGNLSDAADQDWYLVDVQVAPNEKATVVATMKALSGRRFRFGFADPAGARHDSICLNDEASLCTTPELSTSGKWKIGVLFDTGAAGLYALTIDVLKTGGSVVKKTCEPSGDAPDRADDAAQVTPPLACNGELSTVTDQDWYKFTVDPAADTDPAPPAILAALVPLSGGQFHANLVDPSGGSADSSCQQNAASACAVNPAVAGTWRLGVTRDSGTPGAYALVIHVVRASGPVPVVGPSCEPIDGQGNPVDASNDPAKPSPLPSATGSQAVCQGTLGTDADGVDWYTFRVTSQVAAIQIVAQPGAPDVDVTLTVITPAGAATVAADGGAGQPERFAPPPAPGTSARGFWKVGVALADGSPPGGYALGTSVEGL